MPSKLIENNNKVVQSMEDISTVNAQQMLNYNQSQGPTRILNVAHPTGQSQA